MTYPGAAKVSVTTSRTVKVVIGRFRSQYSRAGTKQLTIDEVAYTVSFGTPLPDTNYVVQGNIFNSADNPDLFPFFSWKVTQKTANGFTFYISSPPLSNNANFDWSIAEKFNP